MPSMDSSLRPHQILTTAAIFLYAGLLAGQSQTVTLLQDDFSTFPAGNLVGQSNYALTGAQTTLPIQVTSGQVVLTGGATTNDQDVYKAFTGIVSTPASGTTSVFASYKLTIDSIAASGTPSYFLALDGAIDGSGFDNFRVGAQTTAGGYLLAVRVNGQAGYPFAFTTNVFTLGTQYTLVVEADLVAGASNDVAKLFVLPASANPLTQNYSALTPDAVAPYTSGAGTDPGTIGAIIFSQFGTAAVPSTGARVAQALTFMPVPEPSVTLSFGLGIAGLLAWRRRQ